MPNEKEEIKEDKILKSEPFIWVVPQCCREGWDSCKHSAKPFKKKKTNVGL